MEANMSPEYISFCKTLHKYSLSRSFQLQIPKQFSEAHFPCHDSNVILVDESEREHTVTFLINRYQLGSGWREFVEAHGLLEGDKLVFRLIDPCKFKVHIIRASRFLGKEFQNNKNSLKRAGLIEETTQKHPVSHAVGPHQVHGGRTHSSTESNGADGTSNLNIYDRPCDDVTILKTVDVGNFSLEQPQIMLANMSQQSISFSKTMVKSNLSPQFQLQIPKQFPDAHLPCHNSAVILVDESEREYSVAFSAKSKRFVGGWRDFSITHGLLEGDTLVFHLIDKCKFKVHITRQTRISGADGNLNIHERPRDCENASVVKTDSSAMDIHDTTTLTSNPSDQCDDYYHSVASLSVENSESALNFEDIKGFEYFKIHVNGENVDSEIPADIRTKYYQLCCVQKTFLHDHVLKELNSKLVVAMILEIVSIADSTKATSLLTPLHDLERMDKNLKSFEELVMTVELLRSKIGKLIKISSKHQSVAESTRVKLARVETERTHLRAKKAKIDELTESAIAHGELIGHLEGKINALKEKKERLGLMFNKTRKLLE